MQDNHLNFYKRLGHAIALQFGEGCEVVIHDLKVKDPDHSIVWIENGHVTGRKVGDGPSHVVLEALHAGFRRACRQALLPHQDRKRKDPQVLDRLSARLLRRDLRHLCHQLRHHHAARGAGHDPVALRR